MAQAAAPTSTPTAGKVPVGTNVALTPAADTTVYFTIDGSTPSDASEEYVAGAFDDLLDQSGANLTIKAIAYDDLNVDDPSDVVTFRFDALGFSGAVGATAPAIVDTAASQGLGAATQGIGLVPADEASIGGSRLGGAPGTALKGDTGDGPGV